MQVDFLIVGQGLAGSLLAKELLRRGRSFHVVDDRWKSSSSQVAAGLMTPLTGRRFTLTKDYPELFASAQARLTELGVFRPIQVYRMFVDDEQRAKGLKRTECRSCQPFIERVTSAQGELDVSLTDTFGGALMNGAWVDLPKLLSDVRTKNIVNRQICSFDGNPTLLRAFDHCATRHSGQNRRRKFGVAFTARPRCDKRSATHNKNVAHCTA